MKKLLKLGFWFLIFSLSGDQWIHNIYFEASNPCSKLHFYDKTATYCKYMNGFTMTPPDDIGGLQDFYLSLLKCYDCYNDKVGDFGSKTQIYEWMQQTAPVHFHVTCKSQYDDTLSDKQNRKRHLMAKKKNNNFMPKWNPYCFKRGYELTVVTSLKQLNKELRKIHKQQSRKWHENNIVKKKRCLYGDCMTTEKRLKRCKNCFSASYCSRKCQKKHWNVHREKCLSLY